ncbi:hypothetical protein BN110_042 [Yersinia phage phiR8-01]|uniref:Uncharacterized protein n=1 Tax=Yersinia phage phiR8-01 TaxID=1206556 RepID=I7LGX4_9CAUD|nr:hypothetical protein HOT05_gp33 [Yersinia phage phiR8-01]CCI88414.2 hypothetical protein BN110_042 [Yersinia phage phiR8-01]
MGKAFKKITKPFSKAGKVISKGIGAITGTNAVKKAAEEQARQMEQQNAMENTRNEQQMEQMKQQTMAQQQAQEQNMQREKVMRDADDARKRAQEQESSDTADVDVGGGSSPADGSRVNLRKKFQSRSGGATGAGISI